MSDDAEILSTELTISFGATIGVTTSPTGYQDWIKPGASFSTHWKGIPTEEQLKLAADFIERTILAPMVSDLVASAQQRLMEARRGR